MIESKHTPQNFYSSSPMMCTTNFRTTSTNLRNLAQERQSLLGRYRNLEHDYDGMNALCEEEMQAKDDLARQCGKAEGDANLWRMKVWVCSSLAQERQSLLGRYRNLEHD